MVLTTYEASLYVAISKALCDAIPVNIRGEEWNFSFRLRFVHAGARVECMGLTVRTDLHPLSSGKPYQYATVRMCA